MDLNFLRSRPELRNNTLKFERDSQGEIFLRPTVGDVTKRFYNFPEAQSHVRSFLGVTSHKAFTADSPVYGVHPIMRQTIQEITQFVPGAEVSLTSFNVEDVSSVEQVKALMQKGGGWLVPDSETASLLQVKTPDGNWSDQRIAEHMSKRYGQSVQVLMDEQRELIEFGDKFFKRAKTPMNAKTFGVLASEPINISVIDSRTQMNIAAIKKKGIEAGLSGRQLDAWVDDAIESAADGYNEGSTRFFRRLREGHSSYLTEIQGHLDDAVRMGADDMTISRLREELKKAGKSVTQLDEILERGSGTFYMQHMGGEAFTDATGAMADAVRKINSEGIYLKGGLWLNPNLDDTVDLATFAFVDTEGVVRHGFKGEYTMTHNLADPDYLRQLGVDKVYGTTSLTPKEAMDAYLDVQHASSYPEFISKNLIEEGIAERSDYINDAVRAMSDPDASRRVIPSEFKQILESQLDSDDPLTRETAQNILDFVERHPLSDDPHMMRRALDTMLASSLKDKGRGLIHPKIRLPDTKRAEIAPYSLHARTVTDAVPEVEPGYMRFHKSSGNWIVHEADFHSFGPAWGGPDFDDTVLGTLRYDRTSREVVAPMIRQPQARGEWVYTRIHQDDDFLGEVIQRSMQDDTFNNLIKRKKQISREVDNLQMRFDRAQAAGAREVAGRLSVRLESARQGLQSNEAQIHDLLETNLGSIDDMKHPTTGQLPGRRGFVGDAFVGQEPVQFTQVDGTNVLRYKGESPLLAYEIKKAATEEEARRVAKHVLSGLSPEEQAEAFSGVLRRFSANVEDGNVLGQWGNARMFYDHWLTWNEDSAIKHGLSEFLPRTLLEMETVVDVAVQGVRDSAVTPETISRKAQEIVKGVVKASAMGVSQGLDTRIDPAIFKHKATKGAAQDALAEVNEELAAQGKELIRFESPAELADTVADRVSLFMHPSDERATWSAMMQGTEQLQQQVADLIADQAYPRKLLELDKVRYSKDAERDAKNLIKSYKNAEARLSVRSYIADMDAVIDEGRWADYIEGATGMTSAQYNRMLQDEFLGELVKTFDTTDYGERMAGERTYAALARTMQMIEDSTFQSTGVVGQAMARIGIYADVLDWAGGAADAAISHKMGDDVYRVIGSMTKGADLNLVIDDMLRGTDVTTETLEWMTKGIDVTGRSGVELPEPILRQLADTEGPSVTAYRGRVTGPTDPRTLIRGAGQLPGEATSLGELALLYQREGLDPARRREIGDTVSQALTGFRETMEDWAGDAEMPDRLRDYTIRSMERGAAPGSEKAARARAAAQQAADVAEVSPMKRGFRAMLSELGSTRGGRGIAAGVAGLAAIGTIHAIRGRDKTINDMQGPAFLPGGNPYADDPNAHGSMNPSGYGLLPPGSPSGGGGQGTTYAVRTRGGNYDSSFVDEVSNITGGNVTGTTYDAGNPFQSRDVKQRILESYG